MASKQNMLSGSWEVLDSLELIVFDMGTLLDTSAARSDLLFTFLGGQWRRRWRKNLITCGGQLSRGVKPLTLI